MNEEYDKITRSQYLFLIIAQLMGYVFVLTFTDSMIKQDAWLVVVFGVMISVPFTLCYASLTSRFPSCTLVEILQRVFGRAAGTVLSVLYAAFFSTAISFVLIDLRDFYTGYVMPEAPGTMFVIVVLLVAYYAVRKGMHHVVRFAFFIAVLGLVSVALVVALLSSKMDFSNLLPMLRQPPRLYLASLSQFALVPCGQMLYLMMLGPRLASVWKLGRVSLLGLGISGLLYAIISVHNTAALGPLTGLAQAASYETVRMINIANLFTRMELIVGLTITFLMFVDICILYYAATKSLQQLLRLRSHHSMLLPVGGIALAMTFFMFDSGVEHVELALRYNVPVFGLFHFIVPPLALLVAKIRKLKGKAT